MALFILLESWRPALLHFLPSCFPTEHITKFCIICFLEGPASWHGVPKQLVAAVLFTKSMQAESYSTSLLDKEFCRYTYPILTVYIVEKKICVRLWSTTIVISSKHLYISLIQYTKKMTVLF